MKILIASDIHGDAQSCASLLAHFDAHRPDLLLLLGDLLYHGPRNDLPAEYDTKAVTKLLNGVKDKLLCVKGNCDSEVDQMVLEFPMMAEYAVLPVGERLCYLTHGHNYGPDKLPPMAKGDLLMSGHIHIPVCRVQDDILLLNPGSVSLPKENTPHSYMTLEGNVLEWKHVENGEVYKRFEF